MWKIKRYTTKDGLNTKTIISYNDVPVGRICSYSFGTEIQTSDTGNGCMPVDILNIKIQMPRVDFEQEIVNSITEVESKYSKEELVPTDEDKEFSINLLKKGYAAQRAKMNEEDS